MSLHVHANGLHNRVYCVYCKPRINNWNYEQTLFSIQTCLFSCAAFQSVYLMQAWVIVGLRTCVCTGRLEKRKDAVVRGNSDKASVIEPCGSGEHGGGGWERLGEQRATLFLNRARCVWPVERRQRVEALIKLSSQSLASLTRVSDDRGMPVKSLVSSCQRLSSFAL